MATLDNHLQDKIDELVDLAYEKSQDGDRNASFQLLFEAWELYPEPKEQWNEAYNTAKYIFEDYFAIEDYNSSKKWLDEMIKNNDKLNLSEGEVQHFEGKYYFEVGDYQKAQDKFKYVVNEAGFRYFEDEDTKYLDFYRNPEKYINS